MSAILYCFVFLYLAVAGGGAWSLDNARAGTPALHIGAELNPLALHG